MSITFSVNICTSCRHAIADILNDDYPDERWTTVSSEHNTITYFHGKNDNTMTVLSESFSKSCELCAAILGKLAPRGVPDLMVNSTYSMFVKPKEAPKYRLYICLGESARYTDHIGKWYKEMPAELRLFGKSVKVTHRDSESSHPQIVDFYLRKQRLPLSELFDGNLGSTETFEFARTWVRNCFINHKFCQPGAAPLPRRLLKLRGGGSQDKVKLYLTSPGETGIYATLSYTWGASGYKRLKTLNHTSDRPDCTEESHCKGIEMKRFPQTLLDAILIAEALGFQYLWIDSLCIVQDSVDDWNTQSAEMTQIYSGARLNISATDSKTSEFGILRSIAQQTAYICRTTIAPASDGSLNESVTVEGQTVRLQDVSIGDPPKVLDLEAGYLATRAWVFQERLVSSATLHYTNQGLIWECVEETKYTHRQGISAQRWKKNWRSLTKYFNRLKSADQTRLDQDAYKRDALESWKQWIAAYSSRELYTFEDKLPAIAGVAKTLASYFELSYKAGLWQEDLLSGLMWKRCKRTTTLKRFEHDKSPSWSWASVQGKLVFVQAKLGNSSKGSNLEFLGAARVTEEAPGSFGRVVCGEIHVRGRMQQIVVDKNSQPIPGKPEYQEFGIKFGFISVANVFVTYDEPVRASPFCWCLRLGSWDDDGRDSDVFLLLEQVSNQRFRRVGIAETDAWLPGSNTECSGLMTEEREYDIFLQ